jgi:hypothetical protein
VDAAPAELRLEGALGLGSDYLLSNGVITVVMDHLDAPRDLAPTGGTIIDMGPVGGRDEVNQIYHLAGILPEDAFAYTDAEIVDASPDYVALVVGGTLDGREDVDVVTRYELHPCEPGVRVRSELYNGTRDIQVFVISDAAHWGKRDVIPFAPLPGQGFFQPSWDLIDLQSTYEAYDYVAGRPSADDAPSYGFVGCDREQLRGVNDVEITAVGTDFELIRPGESLALERFILTAAGDDLDGSLRLISQARRALHGDDAGIEVSGRVLADGAGFGGTLARAALVLGEEVAGELRPLTMVTPEADGTFVAEVPTRGELSWELHSFGRSVAGGTLAASGDVDLGDLDIDAPATAVLSVTANGAEPIWAEVAFVPRQGVSNLTGSFFGVFRECAPWLGSPVGASPACNRVLVAPQGTDVELPAGSYWVVATAGPNHSLARASFDITSGESAQVDLDVTTLSVEPDGWLAADLHVHGWRSFDSSLPDADRVASFVTSDVDVIAATDHDWITDYADAIAAIGADDQVAVMAGLETTPLIPFLDVPGKDVPKVIGHYNFWPLSSDGGLPRGGAPWDELMDAGELYDVMAPLVGEDGALQMNHPWDDTQFGRDLGYLRAIGFDPRVPIEDDRNNRIRLERPGGGLRNVDFNLIEIGNGAGVVQFIKSRVLWHSLISQGFVRAGTASSDSHYLADALGYGRTLVETDTDVVGFAANAFNAALLSGKAMAGNGVVIITTVGAPGGERRGLGFEPYVPAAGDTLEIEVRAAPWIPVHEVRVVTGSGVTPVANVADLSHPADPFGIDGVVRLQASFPLADLVDGSGDDWLIVEAGMSLFDVADIDDDGVPDTTDNNGDGVIDEADVEEDEDSGPLEQPADPDPEDESDPRYWMTRVVHGAFPYAFTNPILIDGNGGGWDAPGLEAP